MVFVVIEGLDGSGKTTQALRLRRWLARSGHTVHARFHPSGDSWAGRRARRFLLAEGRSAHFAASMFYILDVLRSVLLTPWRAYDYVVYVRYLMGTAYLPPPLDAIAYGFFAILLPRPRITFFLEVDPAEAHRRIDEGRDVREMFESIDQLEKIRKRALSLARAKDWAIVDANGVEDEVTTLILGMFPYDR